MKNLSMMSIIVVFIVLSILIAGCGSNADLVKKIDVFFPSGTISWKNNGENLKKQLQEQGFKVNLFFARTGEEQAQQVEQAAGDKADCLVVGAVNSKTIGKALEKAQENNIPIIAYDRLPMNTKAVNYYATFDNEGIGIAMGKYIVQKYGLKNGAGPYTVELFQGSDDDNNAHLIYKGLLSVIKPYLDNGELVVPSGKISFKDTTVQGWKTELAEKRMKDLKQQYYNNRNLDIIICASDNMAEGVIKALEKSNYSGKWPFITGQDAAKKNVEFVAEDKQGFTLLKSSNIIGNKCIRMVKAVVEGTKPEINDIKTYNNGVITVPSYLCIPLIIDRNNIADAK